MRALDSTFDKIRDYVLGHSSELPEQLELIRQRWSAAFTHMNECDLKSDRQVAKLLMSNYHVSERTAYHDIFNAKRLYGGVRKSSKESERYIASETSKELFGTAWRMFLATKQYQWYVAAVSQQKMHAKVNGLEKDDPELPDPSKINPPIQILQINFDFLTSQYAPMIDDKAKQKLNALLSQMQELVESSRINDYLDVPLEIPHIEG
jgi:hypothetical protein